MVRAIASWAIGAVEGAGNCVVGDRRCRGRSHAVGRFALFRCTTRARFEEIPKRDFFGVPRARRGPCVTDAFPRFGCTTRMALIRRRAGAQDAQRKSAKRPPAWLRLSGDASIARYSQLPVPCCASHLVRALVSPPAFVLEPLATPANRSAKSCSQAGSSPAARCSSARTGRIRAVRLVKPNLGWASVTHGPRPMRGTPKKSRCGISLKRARAACGR